MTLQLEADQATLRRDLAARCPDYPRPPKVKAQLLDYQMMALFLLARDQNRPGARILEIGTGHGSSGWLLSRAAPLARITSLTTSVAERGIAERLWRKGGCRNIVVRVESSWDVLARDTDAWDLIFIDGDHNRIARDLPWFNRLREGGLLLCHDYSPQDSRSPSGIVFAELNAMAERLGRPFDVRVIDEGKVGMVGFYCGPGETVDSPPQPAQAATTRPLSSGAGLVLRREEPQTRQRALASRLGVSVSDDWTLLWPRTLFVAEGAIVPWDLVGAGLELLARWDLAAPLAPDAKLAQDLGTPDDRDRTRALVGDLRMPTYAPDLLFVRDSDAGRACLERWRIECDGSDERLAFQRALSAVKPRFCALPRIWLAAQAERDAIDRRSGARSRP